MSATGVFVRAAAIRRSWFGQAEVGFTLVELLISLVVGSLLMGGIATMIVSHIRATATAELAQRIRDDANRLNYFVQMEANEAVSIGQNINMAGCPVAAGAVNSAFSLNVPLRDGAAGIPANVAVIHYYFDGTDLRRCGPAIRPNGSLDFATNIDSIVSPDTFLNVAANCQGEVSDARQISYQVLYLEAGANLTPPCATARAKSFFVVDP